MGEQILDPETNRIGIPDVALRRFMRKIDRKGPNECWVWLAYRIEAGYGHFRFGEQGSVPWRSHRLAYALATGDLAEGFHLHHKCNNRACVNPNHLERVTPREHVVERTLNSPPALCAAKTHCHNGHEFNAENTRYQKNGKRVCRICNSAWNRKKYAATHPGRTEKTHCINGHEFTPENTYTYKTKSGVGRGCRECGRRIALERLNRKRDEINARARELRRLKKLEGKN